MRLIQTWCVIFLSTLFAVGISVTWLDRPIALLVHDSFGRFKVSGSFTGTPSFFSPLALFVLLVIVARRIAFRPFGKLDIALLLADVSIMLAKLIMPSLKLLFGRTWPQYHHPSLIDDGVYGFNFLRPGREFESFPSGHMASICALIIIFWICYPRFRPAYAAVTATMAGGLILGNYHFLSDVFAGVFVGSSTGVFVVLVWEAAFSRLFAGRVESIRDDGSEVAHKKLLHSLAISARYAKSPKKRGSQSRRSSHS